MSTPSETRVIESAKALSDYLWANSGETADWPVGIVAREPEGTERILIVELLNELRTALKQHEQDDARIQT